MHEIYSQKVLPADIGTVRQVRGFEVIRTLYPSYLTDESKLPCRSFDYLFFPNSERELSAILHEMNRSNKKVTIAGARTGLVGGCVPDQGALISLENLDRVESLYYDPPAAEWRLRAQPGISLKEIDEQLSSKLFPDLQSAPQQTQRIQIQNFRKDPDSYIYPPDPTEMSASLGGTVATNASGARTFRFGPTRDWVRGLRVMLSNGEVLDVTRGKYFASHRGEFVIIDSNGNANRVLLPSYRLPRTKNTSGVFVTPHMDLIDLFIGSEGIFGIITEVTIALHKRTPKISIVQFLSSDEQAIKLVQDLRRGSEIQMDFLEYYSGSALALLKTIQKKDSKSVDMPTILESAGAALFFEFDFDSTKCLERLHSIDALVKAAGASSAESWVAYEQRDILRLKNFRHKLPETVNALIAKRRKRYPGIHKLGTDLAVPDEHLYELWKSYKEGLKSADLEWVAFGHIGDNHIHINIIPRDMADMEKGVSLYHSFCRRAVELEGTVSAEHGIGKLKVEFLKTMYSPNDILEMRAAKHVLDSNLLLNPGNVFDS